MARFYSDLEAFTVATGGQIPQCALKTEESALKSGRYRLEHGLATGGSGIAVVWGGYGFATFYLAKRVKYARMVSVVPLKALRNVLKDAFTQLELPDIILVNSVQELQDVISDDKRNIDFALFLSGSFSNGCLDIFEDGSVKFLSGEFDPLYASPVQVYRQSKRVAEKFIWTWGDEGAPVVGGFWNGPEVSIIVPAFNAERTLQRCLDSLTSQTIKQKEIIIINDGSTDKTGEIAEGYACMDSSIRSHTYFK